jgi:hypothetical protein
LSEQINPVPIEIPVPEHRRLAVEHLELARRHLMAATGERPDSFDQYIVNLVAAFAEYVSLDHDCGAIPDVPQRVGVT